eukprot:gene36863-45475_t
MSPERILAKLEASAHSLDKQVDRPMVKNITWIKHAYDHGLDVLKRPFLWEKLYVYKGEVGYPSCPTCEAEIKQLDLSNHT